MTQIGKVVAILVVAALVGMWMGGGMSNGHAAPAAAAVTDPAAEGAGPEFETGLPRAAF